MWVSQPRQPPAGAEYQQRTPRYDTSGSRSDDEGVRRQRAQRQDKLRSLRYDLGGGGPRPVSPRTAAAYASASVASSDGESDMEGEAGGRRLFRAGSSRELRPPRIDEAVLASLGSAPRDSTGMLEPGYFLRILQGGCPRGAGALLPARLPAAPPACPPSAAAVLGRAAAVSLSLALLSHPCTTLLMLRAGHCCCPDMLLPGWLHCADLGAVDDTAQPTAQGLQHCVGQSTFMNVCINKLLAHCTE